MFLLVNQNEIIVDKVDKIVYLNEDDTVQSVSWEGKYFQGSDGQKIPVINFFPDNMNAVRAYCFNGELPSDFAPNLYKMKMSEETGEITFEKIA